MIGRRATVGLSLLLALVVCAFAAQGASAVVANNTTAFTCVDVDPGKGVFGDAHCDKKMANGNFQHQELSSAIGKTTEIIFTNEKTNATTTGSTPTVIKGILGGVTLEVTCQSVAGEGSLGNTEPSAKVHRISSKVKVKRTKCTVNKPLNCTVKEPIESTLEVEGVEGLGPEKNEMGLEMRPESGKIFSTLDFEGEKCAFKGTKASVEGTAIATGEEGSQKAQHSGATWILTNAMTKETLTLGGKAAEMSAIVTPRMDPKVNGTEKPISYTTVT